MPPENQTKPVDEPNQWIFFMPKGLLDKDDSTSICPLRHPRTRGPCMVLFSDHRLYEITQCRDDNRSWFIDDTVQKDGSFYMTTPMDALYMILPYLITASKDNKFSPLDQIIHDDEFPEAHRLCEVKAKLENICDCKGSDDLIVCRYSEEKTLAWLKGKIEKVIDCLKEEKIHVGPGYVADTHVVSKKEQVPEEYYVKYAFELVSDYLETELSEKLRVFMDIKEIKEEVENVSDNSSEPPKKRQKKEGPVEDYSGVLKPIKAKQNQTAAQKRLEKVDKKGIKSITSFFSVKQK